MRWPSRATHKLHKVATFSNNVSKKVKQAVSLLAEEECVRLSIECLDRCDDEQEYYVAVCVPIVSYARQASCHTTSFYETG